MDGMSQPAAAGRGGAKDDRERSRDLGQLRQLVPFLRPYAGKIMLAGLSLATAAGAVLVIPWWLRRVVNEGFAASNAETLNDSLGLMVIFILLLAVATFGRYYFVTWVGERVTADIRMAVYSNVLRLSPGFFETVRTGEILSRLTADTTLVQAVIGSSASVALRNVLLLTGGLVMLAITSPKLTLYVLAMVPLVVLPIVIFGRKVRKLSRESQDRVADVSSYADESLGAIRTLQAFTYETVAARTFAGFVDTAFEVSERRIRARGLLTMVVIALVFGAVALLLWTGGHDVIAGRMDGGQLLAFVFYAVIVASSTGALSEIMGDLQRAAGAAERLTELLHMPVDIGAPASPESLPVPFRGAVAIRDVTFCYPSRPDAPSLKDFSLDVAAGETVALVGPSGAGKTTVFQLLLRFYDPQSGVVSVDGLNVRDLEPTALRAGIGMVSQEPAIFAASARENIRYGRPDATDDEVTAAAKAAFARDFIEALPEGFDTYLGERGVRLSGGQRQRIAIARAILRDPALLLLDEATSALDAESERAVQLALEKLMVGRTTIVIAHRLSTVLGADRIVVIEDGSARASGTHDELMKSDELYARLARLQFDADKNGRS
ncbi:ATP-binding cassette domain-containing protein [Alphaproteobacteria bacterium HT1-32]|nr:ATP-binding cassette domain-containing protein [Alphaproteobacteria bacterium HT1-32]